MKISRWLFVNVVVLFLLSVSVSAQPLPGDIFSFGRLPDLERVEAAAAYGPIWIMLFSGDRVFFLPQERSEPASWVARQQIPGWSTPGGFDAALAWDTRFVLLFRGNRYARFDLDSNSVSGSESWAGWPAEWRGRVDAAVRWDTSQVFFFRGTDYVVYDVYSGETSRPESILEWIGWPPHWTDRVDAVLNPGYGVIYFFRGSEFLPYSLESMSFVAGYPRTLPGASR